MEVEGERGEGGEDTKREVRMFGGIFFGGEGGFECGRRVWGD